MMAYFSPDEVARWADDNACWQARALEAEAKLAAAKQRCERMEQLYRDERAWRRKQPSAFGNGLDFDKRTEAAIAEAKEDTK